MTRLLDTATVSSRLGVSQTRLGKWRAAGVGPKHVIGERRRVYYPEADLEDWLNPKNDPLAGSDKLLSTKAASRLLGVHYRTLAAWRRAGTGPRYVKFGSGKQNAVRYREGDIHLWMRGKMEGEKTVQHDRDYYRCLDSARLIEEAKYNPNAELAVVLAERLEDSVEMKG